MGWTQTARFASLFIGVLNAAAPNVGCHCWSGVGASSKQLRRKLCGLSGIIAGGRRRGSVEAAGLTAELAAAAGAAAAAISEHMAREEAAVLPLLTRGLCRREQRAMVWRTLRAMPLRLLERVLPWLAGAGPCRTACTDACTVLTQPVPARAACGDAARTARHAAAPGGARAILPRWVSSTSKS